jgi:hypothetical protein
MLVDPKIEKPTRDMFELAIRGEAAELATFIQAVGNETYRASIGLCLVAAGYVAIDVSGRWPTDADVRQIAQSTTKNEARLELRESDVYEYLSGAVLDFKRLDEVLGSMEAALTLPILITASMVFTFRPRGQDWWQYLDTIWNAANVAERTDLSVGPALTLRARRSAKA